MKSSLLALRTIEDSYQEALKEEEKISRKQNQENRGRGPTRRKRTSQSQKIPNF
jgi:hypothetical protein